MVFLSSLNNLQNKTDQISIYSAKGIRKPNSNLFKRFSLLLGIKLFRIIEPTSQH